MITGINILCSGLNFHLYFYQGDLIIVANVGDSRAVLGTTSDDGSLVPVQLTVDFKPNLPRQSPSLPCLLSISLKKKSNVV